MRSGDDVTEHIGINREVESNMQAGFDRLLILQSTFYLISHIYESSMSHSWLCQATLLNWCIESGCTRITAGSLLAATTASTLNIDYDHAHS